MKNKPELKEVNKKDGVFDINGDALKNFENISFDVLTKEQYLNRLESKLKSKKLDSVAKKELKNQIAELDAQPFNFVMLKIISSTLNGVNNDREEVFLTFLSYIKRQDINQKNHVFEVKPGKYVLINSKTRKMSEEVDNLPKYINGYFILKQANKYYFYRDSDGFIGGPYANAKPFVQQRDGKFYAYVKTGKLLTHWQEIDSDYHTVGLRDKNGELISTKSSRIEPECAGNEFFGAWRTNKNSHPYYQIYPINYDSREDGIGTDLDSRFSSVDKNNQFDAIYNLEGEGLLRCEKFRVNETTKLPYTITTYVDIIGRTLTEENKASGTALYLYKTNALIKYKDQETGEIISRPFEVSDFNPMDFVNKTENDVSGDIYLKAVLEMYGEKQLGKLDFELAKKKVKGHDLSEKLETANKNFEQILTEKITAALKKKDKSEKDKERLKKLRDELSNKISSISSDENKSKIISNAKQIAKNPKLINKNNPPKQISNSSIDNKIDEELTEIPNVFDELNDEIPTVSDELNDEIPTVSGETAGLDLGTTAVATSTAQTAETAVKTAKPKPKTKAAKQKEIVEKEDPQPISLENDGIYIVPNEKTNEKEVWFNRVSDKIHNALTEMKTISIGELQKRYSISYPDAKLLLNALIKKGYIKKSGRSYVVDETAFKSKEQ